jgi:hypothetical protein
MANKIVPISAGKQKQDFQGSRSITVSDDAMHLMSHYSGFSGLPLDQVVSEALCEWYDTTGSLLIETVKLNREKAAKAN